MRFSCEQQIKKFRYIFSSSPLLSISFPSFKLDHISEIICLQNEFIFSLTGSSANDRTKRYFAHIKTKDGKIIGNAYPEHLPECKPVLKEVQQLQEIDRACRARIQAGNLTPEAARKLVSFPFKNFCSISST